MKLSEQLANTKQINEIEYAVLVCDNQFIKDLSEWEYMELPESDIPIEEFHKQMKDDVLTSNIHSAVRFIKNSSLTFLLPKYKPYLHESAEQSIKDLTDLTKHRFISLKAIQMYYSEVLDERVDIMFVTERHIVEYHVKTT